MLCACHQYQAQAPEKDVSAPESLSPPALQTDYPGKSPLLHKDRTSKMEFHGNLKVSIALFNFFAYSCGKNWKAFVF